MENNIDRVIDDIITSYREIGGINHIEGCNLPSRESIIQIIDSLEALIFPGFKADVPLKRNNLKYKIGEKVSTIFHDMSEEIEKSLRFKFRERYGCDDDGITKPDSEPDTFLAEAEAVAMETLELIPVIRKDVKQDVESAFLGDPACRSREEVILSYPGVEAVIIYRIAHRLWKRDIPLIPRIMCEYIHGKTGIDIHPAAEIGDNFFIDHGTGVVIGETSVVGNNVKMYQGVTLGALSVKKTQANKKRHPTIEDNVTIYSGATILGGRTVIGKGSIIGGNVWITSSVPPGSKIYIKPGQYITS
jgi:serine O-acetyltransferase